MSKAKTYVVSAFKVVPERIKSVSVPALQTPCPPVVPSEKIVALFSPTSSRGIRLDAIAVLSPDIVTTEPLAARKSVSLMSVTVILFMAPGIGVLCPIAFVVKVAQSTSEDCTIAMRRMNQMNLPERLTAVEREENGETICIPSFIFESKFAYCGDKIIQR